MTGREGEDGATTREERIGLPGVVAVAAIPLVLAGNSLVLLLVPWLADLQYALPGFPEDPLGLTPGERLDLAREGIRSIWPIGPGTELLVQAELPTGRPAFTPDEVTHMDDVRTVVRGALVIWLVGVVAMIASLALLRDRVGAIRTALRRGAVATVVLLAVVGLFALASFDTFFRSFHEALFEPGSWQFPADSTLLALYPTRFWTVATGLLVALALLQAAILWLLPSPAEAE